MIKSTEERLYIIAEQIDGLRDRIRKKRNKFEDKMEARERILDLISKQINDIFRDDYGDNKNEK
jgi:hypothetical protein